MKKYLTEFPELLKEWNYEKNIDLNPNEISYGSNKRVWWKCKKTIVISKL